MPDLAIDRLRLIDHRRAADIVDTIAADQGGGGANLTLTIDGASSITLTCGDATRSLLRDPTVATRSRAVLDDRTFILVGLTKSTDRYQLTFEDKVANDLRRQTDRKVLKAHTVTRAQAVEHFAHEAKVKASVDPGHPGKITTPITRSTKGSGKENSWDILGSAIAEPIHWRRFSDGTRLVVGSDDWLVSRYQITTIRENTGGVGNIDFTLDEGRRASSATLDVDADLWGIYPGQGVRLRDMGPADGLWLVSQFTRPLTSTRGTVTLTRARPELPEPHPHPTRKKKST